MWYVRLLEGEMFIFNDGIFYKISRTVGSKCNVSEVLYGTNLMFFEKVAQDEEVQKHGIVAVADLKGFSWKHVKALTPGMISKFATILQVRA